MPREDCLLFGQIVLAMINTVFAQDSQEAATNQWRTVANRLREKFPKLATLMDEAESRGSLARCCSSRTMSGSCSDDIFGLKV